MRAVDMSYDELTREEARLLKEHGWPLVIQCLLALPRTGPEQPRFRITSLQSAHDEYLSIAAYIAIGRSLPGAKYVDLAREGVPTHLWDALKFVAIDVEVPGTMAGAVLDAVARVESMGKTVVVYTNYNTWMNYLRPNNSFALSLRNVPLWNAFWDGDPDVDFASAPFGNWAPEQVALEQWSGGTYVQGQFVDRNTIVHPELIGLGGGDHMPTEEYNELKQRIDGLLAGGAAAASQLDKRLKSAEYGTLAVPIWPVGEVPLQTIRHRGYHSPNQIAKLQATLREVQGALENHIQVHNSSGGVIDRNAGAFLIEVAGLLDEMEQEVRNLASI